MPEGKFENIRFTLYNNYNTAFTEFEEIKRGAKSS